MRHGPTPIPVCAFALMLACLASAPARAGGPPLPDSRLGTRTAPMLLLSRPDVRADLKLSAEQAASAERTLADLYRRAAALKGQPDERVVASRREIDEAQLHWIDQNLSPEQRGRLVQVSLQWEGPSAVITRPLVADQLSLAPEQRARLAQAVTRRHADRDQGHTAPADERPLAEEVLAILTPEQRATWKTMLGRPFTVQPVDAPAGAKP